MGLFLFLSLPCFGQGGGSAAGDGSSAIYIVEHFWDRYNFADTTSTNQACGEQGLSDFIYALSYADTTVVANATRRFASQFLSSAWSRQYFSDLIEHYLFNPHSPLRDDIVYAHILRAMIENRPTPNPSRKEGRENDDDNTASRLRFRLRQISKNQVGTIAADIDVSDADGHKLRLHDVQSPLVLLEFYDPDCETCRRVDAMLADNPLIHRNPRLRLVRTRSDQTDSRYFIPSTPTFYLLDSQKRVLLKAPSVDTLLQYLESTH